MAKVLGFFLAKNLRALFLALCLGIFVWAVVMLVWREASGAPVGRQNVYIGSSALSLLVADEPTEQMQGLSGYEQDHLVADGMIFIFKEPQERTFWMRDMNFALDVLWVNDGKVVKIDLAIPPPEPGEVPVKMHSAPELADMVVELPAGQVARLNLQVGDAVGLMY